MKKQLLLLILILNTFAGFSQSSSDSIYAVVNGNQVTIYQDDASRNCGFSPNLENLYIQDNVISWYQIDTAGVYYGCTCFFDYSIAIDSLNAGIYNVEVYYAHISDTIFEGTTSFTIGSQFPCDDVLELSSNASTCQQVNIKEMPAENLVIVNTPYALRISMNSSEKIVNAGLLNLSGQKVFEKNYASSEIMIPTGSFKSGIYIVSITTSAGQYNRKIVVVN